MARMPGAIWKPITAKKNRKKLTLWNRVNLHVAVSESASLHGFFNRSGRVDSHFYVRKDGTIEQYVDTAYQAFSDLDGNDATISVETQGGVTNADKEQWTKEQVAALAKIFKWARDTHGIANKIATSSKLGKESRGLSWHRLGIDGNFPQLPSPSAGRLQRGGGMHWSKHFGKLCPGAAKIRQIPEIFEASQVDKVSDSPKPTPVPDVKPDAKALEVDGLWGSATTSRAQEEAGTPRDGKVSGQEEQHQRKELTTGWQWVEPGDGKGSQLIARIQSRLKGYKGKIDGIAGPQFWGAFTDHYNTKSLRTAIKRFQRDLNDGKFL